MSFLPDKNQNAYLTVPGNAQLDLQKALHLLPEGTVKFTGSASTLWEENITISPEGGTYIAEAIKAALELEKRRA